MSEVTKMHWTIKVKFYSAIWIALMQWFPGHWPSLRCIMMISPPSLSTPSPHWVSSLVAQSAPSQPRSHSQRQSPDKAPAPGREKWPVVHRPWSEHIRGQPWMVQWRPFQPVTHRHVPFLHWPCSSHLQRISSWSLAWIIFPTQTSGRSPCSDTGSLTSPADTRTWDDGHQYRMSQSLSSHLMFSHWPWSPHSRPHCITLQSAPLQPGSHTQRCDLGSRLPWPPHPGSHDLAAGSAWPQSAPSQPFLQTQAPWMQ